MKTEIKKILIAGVDEAGRGPLAGPVLAASVILDPLRPISGLKDSKLLSEKQRENLFVIIQQNCIAWSVGRADVCEIDALNILQATLLAMKRAVAALPIQPKKVLIDGNQLPVLPCEMAGIINGDKLIPSISAASIIAKVTRDREMIAFGKLYPEYGFAEHKGYGTKKHLAALKKYGATPIHRKSFAPIRNLNNDLIVTI